MTCWRAAENAGSILFAVPESRPQDAQLLTVERWQNGQIRRSYSVSSPGYDAKTRTLSSTYKARGTGDCGTIQEMQWTGWHFRLLNAWSKDNCDGEPFEWDSREKWQVFPAQAVPQQGPERDVGGIGFQPKNTSRPRASGDYILAGASRSKCPRTCSHQSSTRLGSAGQRADHEKPRPAGRARR